MALGEKAAYLNLMCNVLSLAILTALTYQLYIKARSASQILDAASGYFGR